MSYQANIYTACEDLQTRLGNVWDEDKSLYRDRSAFLEFVNSDGNRNGVDQIISPGGGKVRTLNLVYDQPLLESQVTTESDRACRQGEKRGDKVATYEIDTSVVYEASENIAIADLATKCEANSDFIARRLMRLLMVVEQKVATVTATQAAAQIGNYSQDVIDAESLSEDFNLVVETLDSSGNFKAGALELIQWAANASGFPNVVGFGGRLMDQHIRTALVGCCTQWGVDVADLLAQYGFAFAYDRRIANALDGLNTKNLITEPGNFQLLSYLENPAMETLGDYEFKKNEYVTGFTPAGVPVDITIQENCKVLTMQVQATTKLVSKPTDMFPVGSNWEGVTGAAEVTVTNS